MVKKRVVIDGDPSESHPQRTEQCIDGSRYVWISNESSAQQIGLVEDDTNTILREILKLTLEQVVENRWEGRYNYISTTIREDEHQYEISLDIPARMLSVATNTTIKLNLNAKGLPDITLKREKSPLTITDLPRSAAIHRIFVTTTQPADIEIIAFG